MLEFVFDDHYSAMSGEKTPILNLPVDTLFAWCHANPEVAPAFAARVLPILGNHQDTDASPSLHPIVNRLIDDFGERQDVQDALLSNLLTFSWVGSAIPHFEQHRVIAGTLLQHSKPAVRRWARGYSATWIRLSRTSRTEKKSGMLNQKCE